MSWRLASWRAFADVRDQWQRVVTDRYAAHPLLDARFVERALAHFADEQVQLAVSDDAPTAMAVVRKRGKLVLETFAPSQVPMALLIADTPQLAGDRMARLAATSGALLIGALHYDALYHPQVPATSTVVNAVDYADTMSVAISGSFDDYWSARSKNLRRNLRRYNNRAEKAQRPATLRVLSAPHDMPDALARYGEIESRGWKGQQGTAIHADNEQGRFYADLLAAFAETDAARVFELYLGDELAASRLIIQSPQVAVILKTTYDEALSDFAPGRVLLHEVLAHYFASASVGTVEFYTKATSDQLQWATGQRPIRHLNVYRSRLAGRAYLGARRLAHALPGYGRGSTGRE